jgi:hypothetical protein
MLKKIFFLFALTIGIAEIGIAQIPTLDKTKLRVGDMLFQDLGNSSLSKSIKKVTPGYDGKHFSHVAMMTHYNRQLWVIEACDAIVDTITIDSFVSRTKNPVYVGRLKKEYGREISDASKAVKKYFGIPYDNKYLDDTSHIYCAELVYYAYKDANYGKPFFEMKPMTFKDPKSKKTFPGWSKYYQDYFQMEVPEGLPGINPGLLINDERVEVYKLGK